MGALDLPGAAAAPRFRCSSVDAIHLIRSSDVATLGAANQALFYRVRNGGTFTKVGLEVTTQGGNICVGFYANTGSGDTAAPGALIGTSGAVACPAVGYADVALTSSAVVPDGAWVAISSDSATAAFRSGLTGELVSAFGKGRCYKQGSAHPLPSTPSTLTAITGRTVVLVGTP